MINYHEHDTFPKTRRAVVLSSMTLAFLAVIEFEGDSLSIFGLKVNVDQSVVVTIAAIAAIYYFIVFVLHVSVYSRENQNTFQDSRLAKLSRELEATYDFLKTSTSHQTLGEDEFKSYVAILTKENWHTVEDDLSRVARNMKDITTVQERDKKLLLSIINTIVPVAVFFGAVLSWAAPDQTQSFLTFLASLPRSN